MPLAPSPILRAAEISRINDEVLSFIVAQAKRVHELAHEGDSAEREAFASALGTNGAAALAAYNTFRTALVTLGQAGGVPEFDAGLWQVQEDGSVIYVEPEPQE